MVLSVSILSLLSGSRWLSSRHFPRKQQHGRGGFVVSHGTDWRGCCWCRRNGIRFLFAPIVVEGGGKKDCTKVKAWKLQHKRRKTSVLKKTLIGSSNLRGCDVELGAITMTTRVIFPRQDLEWRLSKKKMLVMSDALNERTRRDAYYFHFNL